MGAGCAIHQTTAWKRTQTCGTWARNRVFPGASIQRACSPAQGARAAAGQERAAGGLRFRASWDPAGGVSLHNPQGCNLNVGQNIPLIVGPHPMRVDMTVGATLRQEPVSNMGHTASFGVSCVAGAKPKNYSPKQKF